jgi:hypothetical protein
MPTSTTKIWCATLVVRASHHRDGTAESKEADESTELAQCFQRAFHVKCHAVAGEEANEWADSAWGVEAVFQVQL